MNTPSQQDQQAAEKISEPLKKSAPVDTAKIESKIAEKVVTVETTTGASEVLAGMEGSEINEKDRSVSEKKSDTHKKSSQSSSQKDESSIRSDLKQGTILPTQKIMVRKVKTALHHEIKQVRKQVKKFRRNAIRFAHELAEAFQELKTLRYLLRNITTFTLKFLQVLFEKVQKKEELGHVLPT